MDIAGYKITGTLGEGGMAIVFKAVQLSLDREVAIKVLKANLLSHDEIHQCFKRESKIIARLNHPNIIQVIDQGITDDGQPYFIMPFIKSVNLKVAFKQNNLSQHQALDFFSQIAKGLSYAHKNDIVHCDIKPENILVDFDGVVRVLDFGVSTLAKKISDANDGPDFIMGSELYMSPEQQLGSSKVTPKSDIYSLGVMMYQYFAHELPAEKPVPLDKICKKIAPPINDLIMQCLAKSPKQRPGSAEAVKASLLKILQGVHLNADQRKRAQTDVKKSFVLLDAIKEDEHGSVFLFEEQSSKTDFIIKKKPNSIPGYDEAKKIAELDHHNIAKLYGSSKNQRAFILVQEYCSGGSLADRLARDFELDHFYHCAIGIAEGMYAAHQKKITHGNLRPTNILFDTAGQIKLVDFGLKEHYQETKNNWYSDENPQRSIKDAILADIYAVGVIFYQMVAGEPPDKKVAHIFQRKRFKKLPFSLQILLKGMVHKDPKKRIPSFKLVIKALKDIPSEEHTIVKEVPQPAADIHVPQAIQQSIARTRRPFWWALTGVFLFIALILFESHLIVNGSVEQLTAQFMDWQQNTFFR